MRLGCVGAPAAHIDIEDIANLTDAAIRMSMCKTPLRLPSDIKRLSSSFSHYLADVAPVLWSPGYCQVRRGRSKRQHMLIV